MKNILVVGQTPPPIGGQAVMIKHLLDGNYSKIKLFHVRMSFSSEMKDMGKIQLNKLLHLFSIIFKILYKRIFLNVNILYYPPSGPNSAVYRDLIILNMTRPFFSKTIFHFHASGLTTHLEKSNFIFKYFFRKAFFFPDLCIHLSKSCPQEGISLKAKKNIIIPNGIPDITPVIQNKIKSYESNNYQLNILFVGLLEGSKGEYDIIDAVKILKDKGINVRLRILGQFKRKEYENKYQSIIDDYKLDSNVFHLGILKGKDKRDVFMDSDCFCFPTYFHSESFPIVLIEAMQYGIPIIATPWRGIPDMVIDGINGLFVDIKAPSQIAEKISFLIKHPNEMQKLGINARERYVQEYHIDTHIKNIESALSMV